MEPESITQQISGYRALRNKFKQEGLLSKMLPHGGQENTVNAAKTSPLGAS